MRVLKRAIKKPLFVFLFNSVLIEAVFVAVVLTVFHGVPEVPPDSGLVEVLRVFEE